MALGYSSKDTGHALLCVCMYMCVYSAVYMDASNPQELSTSCTPWKVNFMTQHLKNFFKEDFSIAIALLRFMGG